jgi:hypothetical protein
MISSFHCEADENCALLVYYAACSGNFLPTFRDILSVQSSRLKVRNCHYTLRNNQEERSSLQFGDILHLPFALCSVRSIRIRGRNNHQSVYNVITTVGTDGRRISTPSLNQLLICAHSQVICAHTSVSLLQLSRHATVPTSPYNTFNRRDYRRTARIRCCLVIYGAGQRT